ncbi:MAG: cytochrome P450 [Sphingomonadaceae bacterium]|nr:cytochrome P450 [Sphingomonadaceae bacterium]
MKRTVELDIESAEHARNWKSTARDLQETCPMAWSTTHGGFWVATRYRDILRLAQENDTFTAAKTFDPDTGIVEGGTSLPPMPVARLVPAETENPEWEGFRGLLNPRLSPKAVELLRSRAEGFAAGLIDRVIETGRMDIVDDYTNPLTAMVTLAVLGIPPEEWRTFADPLHALTSLRKSDPAYPHAIELAQIMDKRIEEEIDRRTANPGDDLISYLLNSKIDGQALRREDIHQMIFNVIAGGVDTTASLTANVILHLQENPDHRRRLIEDRTLIPKAREEFVRYFSPLHGTVRTAKTGASVAGQNVSAGDRIYLLLASANRDPEIFEDPDEVVLDRCPNRHIGFGAGMHRCVGSFLARMMFETMLNEFLDRIPEYEVLAEGADRYPSISPINGWVRAPISFPPGTRRAAATNGVSEGDQGHSPGDR